MKIKKINTNKLVKNKKKKGESMKEITKLMIDEYKIMEAGFDFMGYRVSEEKSLSYHHLIVPKRKHGKLTVENGAILVRNTAHDYLHMIEKVHRKTFENITREMIEENKKGHLDMINIEMINEILLEFEEKYDDYTLRNGLYAIKDVYRKRLLNEKN